MAKNEFANMSDEDFEAMMNEGTPSSAINDTFFEDSAKVAKLERLMSADSKMVRGVDRAITDSKGYQHHLDSSNGVTMALSSLSKTQKKELSGLMNDSLGGMSGYRSNRFDSFDEILASHKDQRLNNDSNDVLRDYLESVI